MAIGGDGAPSSGTTFLLSFLNVGKKIASSSEWYLFFESNGKKNGLILCWYVPKLIKYIKILEREQFTVVVNENLVLKEFQLELLPNGMKVLCFLGGELSNAAKHFITFANVNQFPKFKFPWNKEERVILNSFFKEYNLY